MVRVPRGGWTATAPVAADDRFVIASATKPVIATLLALLAERGALDARRARGAVAAGAAARAARLTARHLLRHRSGLPEYARDPAVRDA